MLEGGVLLLEASEDLTPAQEIGYIVRSLGERGLLGAVDAVVVSRPPTSTLELVPSAAQRATARAEQRDVVLSVLERYNPDAVVVVGVPFGHTKPHWILPYGGTSHRRRSRASGLGRLRLTRVLLGRNRGHSRRRWLP